MINSKKRLNIINNVRKTKEQVRVCEHIILSTTRECEKHPNPLCCSKSILIYIPAIREYGIAIRSQENSEASSYELITNCPWCGMKLPKGLRDEWFSEMTNLGIEEPVLSDAIPEEFKTDEWWKKRNL